MKKGKIFTNCLCLIFMCFALLGTTACSPDLESIQINDTTVPMELSTPFQVTVKLFSENKDITSKGEVEQLSLFVFDDKNDFFKQIDIDKTYYLQAKKIEIDCPQTERITIVALSNTPVVKSNSEPMSYNSMLSDLSIRLKENNGIVANMPDDLFHGQITLERSSTKATTPTLLRIDRKVAGMSILCQQAERIISNPNSQFFFKIKETHSELNHKGELTGKSVEYKIPATLTNGNLTSGHFTVFPAENYTVELYENEQRILSSNDIQKNGTLTAAAGGQLSVVLNPAKTSCDAIVAEWGTVVQIVTVQ